MSANPNLYNIVSESELSEILSHYGDEYVLSVVENAMKNRFDPASIIPQPNVVGAWEQNFKQLITTYNIPEFINKINDTRISVYKQIIETICKEFKLNFTIDDNIDWYSAAYYLYDFFVCNFNKYMIEFFSKYIFKERNSIYESMNLAELRKNKDTSTAYGKRVYKDIKLAVISANIDMVITNMLGFDIDYSTILLTSLMRDRAYYISSLVSPADEFYREFYGGVMNSSARPVILTEIRFNLQNLAQTIADIHDIADSGED